MATQGQWQGQWGGQWFGPTEPAPPGSMSGSALLSFSATGELTAGNSGFMSGSASLSFSATGESFTAATVSVTVASFPVPRLLVARKVKLTSPEKFAAGT